MTNLYKALWIGILAPYPHSNNKKGGDNHDV